MRVNHVVRTLVLSDFFINSGFSLFAPIFAVFVTKHISGGSIEAIGFAAALTQVFKIGLQIPIARYLDRNHGEYDDFISMVAGTTIVALVPFMYIFATSMNHLYVIQALYGIGLALVVPPWYAIFSRHIDRDQANIEWSMESVGIGLSGALSAAIGGVVATNFGFVTVFICAGLLAIFGGTFMLFIFHDLRAKVPRGQVKPIADR